VICPADIVLGIWTGLIVFGAYAAFRSDAEPRWRAAPGAIAFALVWPMFIGDVVTSHLIRRRTAREYFKKRGRDE
jgi:hypothetical protein